MTDPAAWVPYVESFYIRDQIARLEAQIAELRARLAPAGLAPSGHVDMPAPAPVSMEWPPHPAACIATAFARPSLAS